MKAAMMISVCCAALLGCSDAGKTDLKNPIEISYYFCEGKRTYLSEELRDEAGRQQVEQVKRILGFRREMVNLPDKSFITNEIYLDGMSFDTSDLPEGITVFSESFGDISFYRRFGPRIEPTLQTDIDFNFFNRRGSVGQLNASSKYLNYRDLFSCREITDPKELREVPNKMDGGTLGGEN